MIAIEKEEEIRALLNSGLTNYAIAQTASVEKRTVRRIRLACEAVRNVTAEQQGEIWSLLLAKIPVSAIEMQTGVPRGTIIALRGYWYLHHRSRGTRKLHKCPTCGGMVFPKMARYRPGKRLAGNAIRRSLCPVDIESLYNLAADVVELNNLRIITSPLFFGLARCAEEIINRINDEHKQKTHAA